MGLLSVLYREVAFTAFEKGKTFLFPSDCGFFLLAIYSNTLRQRLWGGGFAEVA